jgi:hypothetical protein
MMTAEEILDVLAHKRFESLRSVGGGWVIRYYPRQTETVSHHTLDRLLLRVQEIFETADAAEVTTS